MHHAVCGAYIARLRGACIRHTADIFHQFHAAHGDSCTHVWAVANRNKQTKRPEDQPQVNKR